MKISEFLPLFKLRSPNLMFFLGAGASISAGIPSAWDIIWDFKRTKYCSENRQPISYCQDLSNDTTRAVIQSYFDKTGKFPKLGSESEYADFFEALYVSETDRRRYIEQLVEKGKPSYGHLVLAALMMMDKIRIIWTTNFDRTVEDAAISLFKSSGKLVVANLDNQHITLQTINQGRWPLLVKLHGDFQSNRLKNTSEELQAQDANLDHSLIESCKRYGLIVAGYSGRDKSIMDSLNLAVDSGTGFPSGLFWLVRPDNPPFETVKKLIDKAQTKGIDAHIIEVETFDEFMGDLLLLEEKLPDDIQSYLDQSPQRVSNAPIRRIQGKWPIIRLNALRIKSWPNICRKVVCNIGGFKEIRKAIQESEAKIIATRRQAGILLFGRDDEAKKAFSKYSIQDFDVHTILTDKFKYGDSQELGLLYEAMALAIGRETSLRVERKRNSYYLVIPYTPINEESYGSLKKVTYQFNGLIPNTEIKWSEAIRIKIEYKFDKLWLLVNPSIWLDRPENVTEKDNDIADEFVREKRATRYNNKMNELLDGCFDAWKATDGLELIQLQDDVSWFGLLMNPPSKGEKKGKPNGYPCIRGSSLQLSGRELLFWTQGNAPSAVGGKNFYKEGKGIPTPILLKRFAGHGSWDDSCRSVLGLTKMNWNNDSLYDRLPVTMAFAKVLAQTIKRMPTLRPGPYEFRFFI